MTTRIDRIKLSERTSPWGAPQSREEIKPGIWSIDTAGHGGFVLDDDRQAMVEQRFPAFKPSAGGSWYEEDCDVCVVVLTFPGEFTADQLRSAVRIVRGCSKWENEPRSPALYGKKHFHWTDIVAWLEGDSLAAKTILARIKGWEMDNADKWERGGMGGPVKGYGRNCWDVHLTRVRDGAFKSVVFSDYPRQQFYTDAEVAELTATPLPTSVASAW